MRRYMLGMVAALVLSACTASNATKNTTGDSAVARAPASPTDSVAAYVLDSVSHNFVVTRKIPQGLKLESNGYYCQMHYQASWDSVQVGDTLHGCRIVPEDGP